MPCTDEAIEACQAQKLLYAPGKAINADGVAMPGLEMSQNSARWHRSGDDLRQSLRQIMQNIHSACVAHGDTGDGTIDYVKGANVAGFRKVADAMLAFGVV